MIAAALVVLLLQVDAVAPAPALALKLPLAEVVGVERIAVENALGQSGVSYPASEVVGACSYRCDEMRVFGAADEGPSLIVELRKGRVTRARWALRGDPSKPRSYPLLEQLFARKRIPEADLVWVGGGDQWNGQPPPKGWTYAVLAWPRWGRITQAVVLAKVVKAGEPPRWRKMRVLEVIETNGHLVDGGLGRAPVMAGRTTGDLLRLYGEPAQVVASDPAAPIAACAGGFAACDGMWVWDPQCHRGVGMVCGTLTAQVERGAVTAAKWSFESELTVWRLPPPGLLFAALPPAPSETASPETYALPDGSQEPLFRRLSWSEAGVAWTMEVACPAVPHGLSVRKPRLDEYRVYSVFQQALPAAP